MRTFRLTLSYDGTRYAGWQLQPERPTIQGMVEQALAQVTGQKIAVIGSGRTDAGVHALGQVASFEGEIKLAAPQLLKALNATLPDDIAALEVVEARPGFHAIRDALRKRYRYVIHDGPIRDVFSRGYAWHVRQPLDVSAMRASATALVGTHDFRSFESHWPNRETSVRTVFDLSVDRPGYAADKIWIEIEADGFLYNMVRAIVGTLVEVGRGSRPREWPGQVLAALNRDAAGPTAPACGLYLAQVWYDPATLLPSTEAR